MIDGALPPKLDGPDQAAIPGAPAEDPEAAATFAALVSQLLGGPTVGVPAVTPQTTGDAPDEEPAETTSTTTTTPALDLTTMTTIAVGATPAEIEDAQPVAAPSNRFDGPQPVAATPTTAVAYGDAPAGEAAPIADAEPVHVPPDRLDGPQSVVDAPATPNADATVPSDDTDEPATSDGKGPDAVPELPAQAARGEHPSHPARAERDQHDPQGPPSGWTVAPHEDGPARPAVADRDAVAPSSAVEAPSATDTEVEPPVVTPVVMAGVDRADAIEAPGAMQPAAAPPVERPVADQVAARVTALDLGQDGRHELSLDLHPAELGGVGVDVVVDAGRVHVTVRADEPAAAALLRDSLDDLRRELAAGGLDVGDLAAHDRRSRPEGRGDGRRGDGRSVGPELTLTFPVRTTATSERGVDVLL